MRSLFSILVVLALIVVVTIAPGDEPPTQALPDTAIPAERSHR